MGNFQVHPGTTKPSEPSPKQGHEPYMKPKKDTLVTVKVHPAPLG